MNEWLNRLRRLLQCGLATAIAMCTSVNVAAQTVPLPGQTRMWLADEYGQDAQFKLQRGIILVWKPLAEGVSGTFVEFNGVLDDESTRVLGELLKNGQIHTLSLAGPGGLVAPTLKLGKALRAKGVTTAVEAARKCYSACALLFLAGETRLYSDEPVGLGRDTAEIGFHAPYIVGMDGYSRHLQDVKTSSSCAYIKQMLPKAEGAELCEYTLATKGIATFSKEAGKRLQIFTRTEAEVLEAIAASLAKSPTDEEQRWIDCERARLAVDRSRSSQPYMSMAEKDSSSPLLEPCAVWRAPKDPEPKARRAELEKAARSLGPRKPTLEMYELARKEAANQFLRAGLTAGEQHHVDCGRARDWLKQENKLPTSLVPEEYPREFATWQRSCLTSINSVKPRYLEGVGRLSFYEVNRLLLFIVNDQGPRWPPPYAR